MSKQLHLDIAKATSGEGFARGLQLLGALNPILLLLIGFVLNNSITTTKEQVEQQARQTKERFDQQAAQTKLQLELQTGQAQTLKTVADTSSVHVGTQINKAKVIADFLNDLTGKEDARRRVALEAVSIVLPPEEARRILIAVQGKGDELGDGASEKKGAKAAGDQLKRDRSRLVTEMFSPDKERRGGALQVLERAWSDDEGLIAQLLDRAELDLKAREDSKWAAPGGDDVLGEQRLGSLSNTVRFLSGASINDPDLKSKVLKFAERVQRNSPLTHERANLIKKRLGSASA